jgi:hypothetical protein
MLCLSKIFGAVNFGGRALTPNEVKLAQEVFGDAIDYSKVRVHKGRSIWKHFLDAPALAVGNHILFDRGGYVDDFYEAPLLQAINFIHEMTHVWQYQHGVDVSRTFFTLRRQFNGDYDQAYECDAKAFAQGFDGLNVEQQAMVVQSCFERLYDIPPSYGWLSEGQAEHVLLSLRR